MGATRLTDDTLIRVSQGIQSLSEETKIERELWSILTQTPPDKIGLSPDMLKALGSFLKKGIAHLIAALTADDYQDLDLDPVEQIYENRTRRLQTLLENCGLEKARSRKMAIAMIGRNANFDIDHPTYRHLRYILKARARDLVGVEEYLVSLRAPVEVSPYEPYDDRYYHTPLYWGAY